MRDRAAVVDLGLSGTLWDLTAVLSRVLGRSWSEAGSLAARIEDSEVLAVALSSDDLGRMAAEVGNADDGVARWCSAVVIGACGAPSGSIRLSLQHALRTERSRENLRTLGTVLSGAGPLAS